jgi:alkanesulfonate monooxygenase SsuD/methylene tetrahydromethanopterin reductase-like flavin-dependent oxidoreductase (luciferase family)
MSQHATNLTLRFDLRVPPFAETTYGAQHQAALDMCEWADARGFGAVTLSEHHGDPAGFTSAPLTLAAAILARTRKVRVIIAALLVPLHDPVRLAEQLATIDCLAPGRLSIVVGAGYRQAEFEMAGVDRAKRGRLVEETVEVWRKAWTGEPFEWRGRSVLVTPTPATPGGPMVLMGGASEAAARRAARLKAPFFPASGDAILREAYEAECRAVGFQGMVIGPTGDGPPPPGFVMVSNDPEAAWAAIGRNACYDAATYASWQNDPINSSWFVEDASSLEGVRASGRYVVVTPRECLDLAARTGGLTLHPLMGGIDPETGWESLRLLEREVLPHL